LFDAHPVGHLPPLLRAEQALARAHLAVDPGVAGSSAPEREFVDAVAAFRRVGSPWHLARALAHHGAYLATLGQAQGATTALDESQAIAEHLGARPLARRVELIRAGMGPEAGSRTLQA
jgi:hypothetical protein